MTGALEIAIAAWMHRAVGSYLNIRREVARVDIGDTSDKRWAEEKILLQNVTDET